MAPAYLYNGGVTARFVRDLLGGLHQGHYCVLHLLSVCASMETRSRVRIFLFTLELRKQLQSRELQFELHIVSRPSWDGRASSLDPPPPRDFRQAQSKAPIIRPAKSDLSSCSETSRKLRNAGLTADILQ